VIRKYKRRIPSLLLAIAAEQNHEIRNGPTMPDRVKHAVARFWELLDSETVRLFVWPFYFGLLAWGIYAVFWAEPPALIRDALGPPAYNVWNWCIIVGTIAVMVGLILRHGGAPIGQLTNAQADRDYLGLILQTGGHACMFFVLLAYEVAGFQGAYWGQGAFSLFAIGPYVMGCFFLTVQTFRKLRRIERFHRKLQREQDQ
jgi:hypothetical protein